MHCLAEAVRCPLSIWLICVPAYLVQGPVAACSQEDHFLRVQMLCARIRLDHHLHQSADYFLLLEEELRAPVLHLAAIVAGLAAERVQSCQVCYMLQEAPLLHPPPLCCQIPLRLVWDLPLPLPYPLPPLQIRTRSIRCFLTILQEQRAPSAIHAAWQVQVVTHSFHNSQVSPLQSPCLVDLHRLLLLMRAM